MKRLELLFIALAVGLIILNSVFIWKNYVYPEKTVLSSYSAPIPKSLTYEAKQFYPNMRYPDKKISFSIDAYCNEENKKNILYSLNILENLTILKFYNSSEKPEIKFICSSFPKEMETSYIVVGEGGPTKIINTSFYSIILEGKVFLYKEEKCSTPIITIHEILHVLGFEHINNQKSIIFPITDCEQTIDSEIIDTINKIYSIESLSDLSIEYANATRIGNYLSFDLTIANLGLKESANSTVVLLSNKKEIKRILLEPIGLGKKIILTAKNVPIFGKSDEITFFIESKEKEISKENNEAVLLSEQ